MTLKPIFHTSSHRQRGVQSKDLVNGITWRKRRRSMWRRLKAWEATSKRSCCHLLSQGGVRWGGVGRVKRKGWLSVVSFARKGSSKLTTEKCPLILGKSLTEKVVGSKSHEYGDFKWICWEVGKAGTVCWLWTEWQIKRLTAKEMGVTILGSGIDFVLFVYWWREATERKVEDSRQEKFKEWGPRGGRWMRGDAPLGGMEATMTGSDREQIRLDVHRCYSQWIWESMSESLISYINFPSWSWSRNT